MRRNGVAHRAVAFLILLVVSTLGSLVMGQPSTVTAESHLGHTGPAFAPGVIPSVLGWGSNAQAHPGKFVVNPRDGAEMVWVPAGKFQMGMSADERDRIWRENGWNEEWKYTVQDTVPGHDVTLTRGFWLYRHAVTAAQYARFLADVGPGPTPLKDAFAGHPSVPAAGSWNDARAYSYWARGRLPTDAQREWAARGPKGYLFPWGNHWDQSQVNSAEYWSKQALNSYEVYHQWFDVVPEDEYLTCEGDVGAAPGNTSWCGALDLVGKDWEWCWDWASERRYPDPPATDPSGPPNGRSRLVRGGSWASFSHNCLAVYRTWYDPVKTRIAFRLVVRP